MSECGAGLRKAWREGRRATLTVQGSQGLPTSARSGFKVRAETGAVF